MPAFSAAPDAPLYVTRPFLPPRAEFDAEVDRIYASGQLTNNGGELRRFAAALCRTLGAQQVSLFANGHLALEAALRVLTAEGESGGEVVTTPFTFASTAHAIVRCGLTPVFCDVRGSDLTLDPQKLEACITPRTRLILPVHVYGHPCDAAIEAIARRHGLPVLYDGAHAFGVTVNGQSLTLRGQITMLSFHATKPFIPSRAVHWCSTVTARRAPRRCSGRRPGWNRKKTLALRARGAYSGRASTPR